MDGSPLRMGSRLLGGGWVPPALLREESPASCHSLLPAPSLVEPGCLGGIKRVCEGRFRERRGSQVEHSRPGVQEGQERHVEDSWWRHCCPMNLSLSLLLPFPRRRKRRKGAERQAKRVNLCPGRFEIIKPEQVHWIPSISISRSQSPKTGR